MTLISVTLILHAPWRVGANRAWSKRDRLIDQSLRLADACQASFERALTLLAMAEWQAASGEGDTATTLIDEVKAICEPLGAKPTLVRAAALAAKLAEA